LNSMVIFLGVVGFAIAGPLVLAAIMAGVMTWLSRQVTVGAPAVSQAAPAAKARSPKPVSPATPQPVSQVAEPQPRVAGAEVESPLTEAAILEREETHHRLVPVWLVAVYAIVIGWAFWYVGTEVVPFFKPLTAQGVSAPVVAPAPTVAPAAPQAVTYSGQGNAANGEKLFTAQGCSACHSLKEGEKIIGPSLYHIGQTAAMRVKSTSYSGKAKTAPEYILESIVEPNAYTVTGFPAGVMPQDFGKKMGQSDLNDLVAFLMTQ